jgi:hypothetical protein
MGGRGFNRVDEEEEASSVNQFLDGEAEHLMGCQTAIALGILIQMDERDVLALKKEAGHPEGRPTNFQEAFNAIKGAETPAHSPAKERKPPATGTGGYSKEELELMFPNTFSGKLGYA